MVMIRKLFAERERLVSGSKQAYGLALNEALVLDQSGEECYRATSARFGRSQEDTSYRRPWVDEQVLAGGGAKPRWPHDAPFAVCLTHDVDHVAWHQPQMHWKRLRNHFLPGLVGTDRRATRGLRSAAVEFGRSLARQAYPDPLGCYERWLEIEQSVGARSTFLFLPDQPEQTHYSDGTYRYTDRIRFESQTCTVAEMMHELHLRGCEVGLHASWLACDRLSEMQRQKEQVERAIDASVVSVHHHYLHFDIRQTPRIQEQAGFLVDSSLGFNDEVGFRHGTSYPWRLWDRMAQENLQLLELPLAMQDKCLLRIVAKGSPEVALETATMLADRVAAVGGVLTLLWHPCTIRNEVYLNLYRELLLILRHRNAWFGTMAEVARWWARS